MTSDANDPDLSVVVKFLPVEMWKLDFKGHGGSLRLTRYDTSQGLQQAFRKSVEDLYARVGAMHLAQRSRCSSAT